ncbi:unnamed protein product [Sphagnum troendelagicum]|uniref:Cytochrome c oxidase subunit 5C n=3 Tax=Sphagnum TaxID=13804 RepID=A0ABP0V4L8_9BRYO|nr:hypothetical protein BDL97_09G070400 [Sphagnum fallax]
MAHAATRLPVDAVAAAARSRPNLLREIVTGLGLGVFCASFWKMHHVNERRKTEEFYAKLDAGEITVRVE